MYSVSKANQERIGREARPTKAIDASDASSERFELELFGLGLGLGLGLGSDPEPLVPTKSKAVNSGPSTRKYALSASPSLAELRAALKSIFLAMICNNRGRSHTSAGVSRVHRLDLGSDGFV